ncbi:MAG: hypothetical protein GEU99_10645 [Luteitalea sp.]|nr:hypothetical protein [Luteitalea sp.]
MNILVRALALCLALLPVAGATDDRWLDVPPADLATLGPDSFSDEELDLPFYLAHFHRLAGSVRAEGPDRGFIDLPVWRAVKDNQPYNARIMENILSLAYFYTTDRPWNVYRGSRPVRQRLEAALDFWCRLQNEDGRFSEYGPEQWNLAATAFATKFIGQALVLLAKGPPLDETLRQRVIDAQRKAVHVVLTDPQLYEHGLRFSNQYTNVWSGALALLRVRPDDELRLLLERRIRETHTAFQSPVGYFYEGHGPDWGYNFGTHQSNLHGAWHYTRGTALGEQFVEEERRWAEWLAYNALPEPDGSGFILNRGIETRQQRPFLEAIDTPLAEKALPLRAFTTTSEELRERRARQRQTLEDTWPHVEPLSVGEFWAFSPYTFLHRDHGEWHPTEAERSAARATLPVNRERFTHQRMDSRHPLVFTYIRRPSYYAAFNSGKHLTERQRYGLGLVWSAETGSLLQSQSGSAAAAWGTKGPGQEHVYEAGDVDASFRVAERALDPTPGVRDLPAGEVAATYSLGDAGVKTVRFLEREIVVEVRHDGPFVEHIPLLVGGRDELGHDEDQVMLTRYGKPVRITFDSPTQPEIVETDISVGNVRVRVVRVSATDRFVYRLIFDAATTADQAASLGVRQQP